MIKSDSFNALRTNVSLIYLKPSQRKICQKTGFLWPVFSRIRTEQQNQENIQQLVMKRNTLEKCVEFSLELVSFIATSNSCQNQLL